MNTCVFDRCILFFFNDTATTEIYTLSLHDALPIYIDLDSFTSRLQRRGRTGVACTVGTGDRPARLCSGRGDTRRGSGAFPSHRRTAGVRRAGTANDGVPERRG